MSETFSLAHLVTTFFPLVDAFVTLASVVKFLLLGPGWDAEGGVPFAHILICLRKYFLVPDGVLANVLFTKCQAYQHLAVCVWIDAREGGLLGLLLTAATHTESTTKSF